MTQTNPDDALAHLERLSQKPGVQSTLILDRHSGAIVRVSGLLSPSTESPAAADTSSPAPPSPAETFAALAFEHLACSSKLVGVLDADVSCSLR
ncbi:MAG: hypothetical protein M1829_000305 [Trizodia sp. TS-e1964]|nr:MAG: hypothetical protein M1829_000305 [Trizodia sp. TS-e1964]